ncbi:MAG: peptidylprolyl isomerase [Candidatus Omnitrophota bacterium]
MNKVRLAFALIVFGASWAITAGLNADIQDSFRRYADSDVVGEAFGNPVTKKEFIYYFKTAQMFTRQGQGEQRTEDDLRNEAWQNLIFLQAATQEAVSVSAEELQAEIERLLAERNIEYGSTEYKIWAVTQFNDQPDVFERRIKDLLVINKFVQLKNNPQVAEVSEEEMKQKFLNQYNSFESEYIRFESPQEAEAFREKVKADPRLWKETYDAKKTIGQKGASWINGMSLEALIDLWKIPQEDAYEILSHKEGDFVVGEFFYGVAVFRLLFKKEADLNNYSEDKKQGYKESLAYSKKRSATEAYFEELKSRAHYRDYVAEKELAEKKARLKQKSLLTMETAAGTIELKLFPDIAPLACENFIGLVEKGYYNGLTFHRVVKDFMIQGGDPQGTGAGGDSLWGRAFADEFSDTLIFDRPGLLAMANSGANTNKSQFFITVKPTPWLDKKHTIFGEVVSGMEVVQKIEQLPTDDNKKPLEEQKILQVTVKKDQPGPENPKPQ